jgi:peroxiredoxin
MTPHLVRWHNQWSDDGLVVIEVDNGQIDSLEEVQAHAEEENLPFPILHDAGAEVCDAYGLKAFPVAYLIDETGKVIWEGHPNGAEAERLIRATLSKTRA